MPAPYYSRETIDARFDALRHELLAAIANLRTEFRAEIADVRSEIGDLRSELAAMRGEWKVWMLVMGTTLAVLSSGVGPRLLNLVWPAGPGTAPGVTSPQQPAFR